MTAPSNSVPQPVLTVAGEKLFQTIVSQIVSMKREMPEPFWSSTSWRRTMRPATNSWMMVMRHTLDLMSLGSPYMPVIT